MVLDWESSKELWRFVESLSWTNERSFAAVTPAKTLKRGQKQMVDKYGEHKTKSPSLLGLCIPQLYVRLKNAQKGDKYSQLYSYIPYNQHQTSLKKPCIPYQLHCLRVLCHVSTLPWNQYFILACQWDKSHCLSRSRTTRHVRWVRWRISWHLSQMIRCSQSLHFSRSPFPKGNFVAAIGAVVCQMASPVSSVGNSSTCNCCEPKDRCRYTVAC